MSSVTEDSAVYLTTPVSSEQTGATAVGNVAQGIKATGFQLGTTAAAKTAQTAVGRRHMLQQPAAVSPVFPYNVINALLQWSALHAFAQ